MIGAACVVQVAPALLSELEARVRGLSGEVGGAVDADFRRSSPVDEAYESLMNRWDEARAEIDHGLTRIAGLVRDIRETFVAMDQQLAAGLGGGGGGGDGW